MQATKFLLEGNLMTRITNETFARMVVLLKDYTLEEFLYLILASTAQTIMELKDYNSPKLVELLILEKIVKQLIILKEEHQRELTEVENEWVKEMEERENREFVTDVREGD